MLYYAFIKSRTLLGILHVFLIFIIAHHSKQMRFYMVLIVALHNFSW